MASDDSCGRLHLRGLGNLLVVVDLLHHRTEHIWQYRFGLEEDIPDDCCPLQVHCTTSAALLPGTRRFRLAPYLETSY